MSKDATKGPQGTLMGVVSMTRHLTCLELWQRIHSTRLRNGERFLCIQRDCPQMAWRTSQWRSYARVSSPGSERQLRVLKNSRIWIETRSNSWYLITPLSLEKRRANCQWPIIVLFNSSQVTRWKRECENQLFNLRRQGIKKKLVSTLSPQRTW